MQYSSRFGRHQTPPEKKKIDHCTIEFVQYKQNWDWF